jgi:hypothetical protein
MATAVWYGLGLQKSFTSTATDDIEWTTDTIKIALVTATYTPNQDTDNYANLAGFTGNELSGGGYARQTLGGKTLTYDGPSNTIRFKATDPAWTAFTGTWRYAVIFKDTGTASTSPFIGLVDFTANQTITAGTFTLNFDTTDGALRIVLS